MKLDLNVTRLLSAIFFLGTATFGLFAYDAERAISRLDEVAKQTSEIHETATVLTTRVDTLDGRVDAQGVVLTDHEKRITSIEAKR